MKLPHAFLGVTFTLLSAASVFAHHPVEADYDSQKPLTLKGTITKVQWKNPHVRIHLDSTSGRSPDSMDWEVELASPNLLTLSGLKMNQLRPGDHLTVDVYPAKDGSNTAYARKVTRDSR